MRDTLCALGLLLMLGCGGGTSASNDVAGGLDGIECFHTKHSTAMSERYLMMADKHRLLVTGGSDCHGDSKGKPLLGTIKLPYEHVAELKARLPYRAGPRPARPTPRPFCRLPV